METTEEEGWVTDQAVIDTIVELKELRPGDEVKIKDGEKYSLSRYNGQIVTVTKDNRFMGHSGLFPGLPWNAQPVVGHFAPNWVFCRGNIGAWRRPKRKGG